MARNRKRKKQKRSKHNAIIRELEKRLDREGIRLFREHEYRTGKEFHEADLLAIGNNYAYAFEVKSSDTVRSVKKAYWQLAADRRYIKDRFGINRIFSFYVYGDKQGGYDIRRVKNQKVYKS